MDEIDTSAEAVEALAEKASGCAALLSNTGNFTFWNTLKQSAALLRALAAERDALAKQLIAVNAVVATFARPDVSAVQRGEAVAVWRDLTPDMLADYPVRFEVDDPAQRLAATAAIHTELVKACRVKA
jgi:hypothetical protein